MRANGVYTYSQMQRLYCVCVRVRVCIHESCECERILPSRWCLYCMRLANAVFTDTTQKSEVSIRSLSMDIGYINQINCI